MKRRWIILTAPLDGVRIDLGLFRVYDVAAERIVIGRTCGRIEAHRLFCLVDTATHGLDGVTHLVRQRERGFLVFGGDVLPLRFVVGDAALSVVGGSLEISLSC